MDNLLLFTPTRKCHIAKVEDLLKALLKNLTQDLTEEVSII